MTEVAENIATPITDATELSCKSMGGKYLSSSTHMALNAARRLEQDRVRLMEALHNLFCASCDEATVLTNMQKQRQTEARALLRELGELK